MTDIKYASLNWKCYIGTPWWTIPRERLDDNLSVARLFAERDNPKSIVVVIYRFNTLAVVAWSKSCARKKASVDISFLYI